MLVALEITHVLGATITYSTCMTLIFLLGLNLHVLMFVRNNIRLSNKLFVKLNNMEITCDTILKISTTRSYDTLS